MYKHTSMDANNQFRKEHAEAVRHNRGQYNKGEIKSLLRMYKKNAGYSFEQAHQELLEYAQKSGTTVPERSLLELWWRQS